MRFMNTQEVEVVIVMDEYDVNAFQQTVGDFYEYEHIRFTMVMYGLICPIDDQFKIIGFKKRRVENE